MTDLEGQKIEEGGKGEIKKVGPKQKSTGCWCEERMGVRRRRDTEMDGDTQR